MRGCNICPSRPVCAPDALHCTVNDGGVVGGELLRALAVYWAQHNKERELDRPWVERWEKWRTADNLDVMFVE